MTSSNRSFEAAPTPNNETVAIIPAGQTPGWIAFAVVSSSYFVALGGVIAYSLFLT